MIVRAFTYATLKPLLALVCAAGLSACGVKMMNAADLAADAENIAIAGTVPSIGAFAINEISPTGNDPISLYYGAITGSYSEYCILENDANSTHCTWIAGTVPSTYSTVETDGAVQLTLFLSNADGISAGTTTNIAVIDRVTPTLASATITNANPTTTNVFGMSYGAITDSYASYCILENNTNVNACSWTANTLPSAFAVSTAQNAKTLSVWLRDSAGNVSARVDTNAVTLDSQAPSLASLDITNSSPTNTQTYGLSFGTITGAYSHYCIRENSTAVAGCSWTAGAVPANYAVSATENAKTLSVWLRDSAGNVSSRVDSDVVTLDKTNPSVTLQSLTGGQTIGGGSSVSITWNATDTNLGATPITISISSDGGATWPTVISGEADDGTYTWTAPVVNSATYRVRVTATDLAGNSASDSSSSNFTINSSSPVVTVTSPNGGETWKTGVSQNITWTSSGLPGGASSAKIEYSVDGGSTYTQIATGEANDGTYSWSVPAVGAGGLGNSDTRIRVTVTDSLAVDTADASDSNFSIDNSAPSVTLTSLTGGQSLTGGNSVDITWTATDTADGGGFGATPISLDSSSDSGSTWTVIATNLANSPSSYSWAVPAVTSKTYRVRVRATDRATWATTSASSADFWINSTTPTVAVTAPNGSEVLAGGASTNITWSSSGLPAGAATAALEYTIDNGTNWVSIAAGVSNSGTYSWTLPALTDTANAKVRVTVTDSFGVQTADASDSVFSIDSSAPTVTLTSLNGGQVVGAGSTQSITWTASDVHLAASPIKIESSADGGSTWSTIVASTSNSGSYPWTVPTVADGTAYRFRVSAVDTLGHSSTSTGAAIFIDNAGPSFTAGTFLLNGGAASTLNNTVTIALTVTDSLSKVNYVCFKDVTTAPAASDTCWSPVNLQGGTPATSVALTNAHYTLEFVPGTYTVYAWAMDEWGFISGLTSLGAGTAARDKATILYDPGTPASVLDVIVANTDAPSTPVTIAERTAASGSDVYIKWKASDDDPIPAGAVALYYTTDETNFTQITSGLDNGANGGCTLTGTATGCYLWSGGSPTSSYLRIRVGVTDADGLVSFGSGPALNTGNFSILAGNIDDGRLGSASAAFFNFLHQNSIGDRKSLVVTSDGTIYLKDDLKGILKIDPTTKVATVFLRETGTSTGDGGPASAATLRDASLIALDFQDRLLIWDRNRIRRVNLDLATPTIETLIGGGASTADTVAATSIQLPSQTSTERGSFSNSLALLDPLPNGDIIFSTEPSWLKMTGASGGARIRRYNASTGQVTSIYPQGTGAQSDSSRVLANSYFMAAGFSFNPITSTITNYSGTIGDYAASTWSNLKGLTFNPTTGVSVGSGTHAPTIATAYSTDNNFINARNGALYSWSGRATWLRRYNSASNTWTSLIGSGFGYCADGTTATSCNARIDDVFINASGRVYLIDNGMVRVIDKDGKMQTIYGQSYYTGNGGLAISARFGDAAWVDRLHNGKLVIADPDSALLREMTIGGTISTIAGNGTYSDPSLSQAATNTPYNYRQWKTGIFTDPTNGYVYETGGTVIRLNRSTAKWESFIPNTNSTCYNDPAADGAASTKWTGTSGAYACSNVNFSIMGSDGTNLLLNVFRSASNQNHDPYMKLFNLSTKVQTHFMGGSATAISAPRYLFGCADGSAVSTCTSFPNYFGSQRMTYDAVTSTWYQAGEDQPTIKALPVGGTISTYATMTAGHEIHGFAIRLGSCSNATYPDVVSCVANSGVWTPITGSCSLNTYYTSSACTGAGGTWTASGLAEKIYYCNAADGRLYRKDIGGATTALSFGSTTIQCTSDALVWDPSRNSVIFGITQNGLSAVAEYYDP